MRSNSRSRRPRSRAASTALAVALVLAAWASSAPRASGQNCTIDVDRELWIRNLSVVEDPVRTKWVEDPVDPSEGAWSFGRLMQHISGEKDPAAFVLDLFDQFRTTQVVNGFQVPPHPFMLQETIDPWIEASNEQGLELDFSIAPFRLNGFVNRLDLRTNTTYGSATSAGEGRIVFSVLRPDGNPSLFTFILEYELLADDCEDVKAWAEAWHALGSIPFGPAYNDALEDLVNKFAGPNVAPEKPNGSALNQCRTNEFFGDDFWQWREFHLSARSGLLEQVTVAQTSDTTLNRTPLLRDLVNQNEAAILDGTFVVPLTFQGQFVRGGASNGEPLSAFFSAKGIANNDARHLFSLNHCVACHTEETGTGFFHSGPRSQGFETFLSGFLTGTSIPDPVDPSVTRSFNDLKRRAGDLCDVLTLPCSTLSAQKPLLRAH
jgi:hypothetical protein